MLLGEMAADRIDELMAKLDIGCRRYGKMYVGPCPVHGGDRADAWNLYPDGHTVRCNWACRTRGCEKIFKKTPIGLVRGVLSRKLRGWSAGSSDASKIVPLKDAIDWVCKFVGQKWTSLKDDPVRTEKLRFASQMAVLSRTPGQEVSGWTREETRQRLIIPSPYFVSRGYLPATLDHFDIGDSQVTLPAHPMFRRAVVPIFNRDGRRVIGATARSTYDQCQSCRRWHDVAATCNALDIQNTAKWVNTKGLARERHLYNYWFAQEHIRKSGQIILVEGPGDVWRLHEAGIKNVVALFGVALNDPQMVLIEMSGCMEVVLLLDNDSAGSNATEDIQRSLRRSFRVTIPSWEGGKDIGELSVEYIQQALFPALRMS